MLLSHGEWEMLVDLTDAEDTSAAEILRRFIRRRHDEVTRSDRRDLLAAVDELADISRRLQTLVRLRNPHR
jgi:hypothetical protein